MALYGLTLYFVLQMSPNQKSISISITLKCCIEIIWPQLVSMCQISKIMLLKHFSRPEKQMTFVAIGALRVDNFTCRGSFDNLLQTEAVICNGHSAF